MGKYDLFDLLPELRISFEDGILSRFTERIHNLLLSFI